MAIIGGNIQVANLAGMFEEGQQASRDDKKRGALAKFLQPARAGDKAAQTALYGAGAGTEAAGAQDYAQKQQGDAREQFGKASVMFSQLGDGPQAQAMYGDWMRAGKAAGVIPADTPDQYDPGALKLATAAGQAYGGGSGSSNDLKSLRIGANGNYWAIRNGQFVDTGTAAAPNNQIVDTGAGFVGIDKRTLGASPVVTGGQSQGAPQPQRAPGELPFTIDPSLPPQVQAAIRANESQFASAADGSNVQIPAPGRQAQVGGQLFSAPKPRQAPAGYRDNGDGTQSVIPGGPAEVANDARNAAKAAQQAANDIKASDKQRAEASRQTEASTAANHLISQIDSLTTHPGFADLGTVWGDTQINTPLIRNDAKDARAKLENIGGQVALSTMARLKSLSSTGATGFGSLTAPELKLLQNSIDTLQSENISNKQLSESLANIRKFMDKTSGWKPSAQGGGAAPKAVNSQAQYDALPSGAIYLEDGQQYRKP